MQSCHDRQVAARPSHLACQIGADGVRYGVMHMNQVQGICPRDVVQPGRERHRVGRMFKKRKRQPFDRMERYALVVESAVLESHGRGIAYEVNVVAPLRKFEAQFGAHDSAAAVRWIACDPDVHRMSVVSGPWSVVPNVNCSDGQLTTDHGRRTCYEYILIRLESSSTGSFTFKASRTTNASAWSVPINVP